AIYEKDLRREFSDEGTGVTGGIYSPEQISEGYPWTSKNEKKQGINIAEAWKSGESSGIGGEAGFIFTDGSIGIVGDSYMHDVYAENLGLEDVGELMENSGVGRYEISSEKGHHGVPNFLSVEFPGTIPVDQARGVLAFVKAFGDNLKEVTIESGKKSKTVKFPNELNTSSAIRDLNEDKEVGSEPKIQIDEKHP